MSGSLDQLLRPKSIAIVGVSQDFNKLNGRPMKFLLEKGYKGKIYPVNPRYEEVGGVKCYPSIAEVPEPVDLAVVALPAKMVLDTIHQLAAAKCANAVVFSSGFGEMGEAGEELERAIVEAGREGGVRILGPNTIGLLNSFEKVFATFTQYGTGETPEGPVGFVTQSGAFGTAIAALARRRGLGLGYFVNTGNECDVDFASIAGAVLDDPRITVGAGYIEGLTDGAGLTRVAAKSLEIGKPLVITKVGRFGAGARAAASHTGSLAGEDAVFDGIVRQYGVVRARNEEHMLDMVQAFAHTPLPAGPGVGLITQSGGAGVLMADRAEEVGLRVPVLQDGTVAKLREILPAFGAAKNPVDVTAQFIADPSMLRDSVKIVLDDPQVDIAVVWFQLMDGFVDQLVEIFRDLKANCTKPFVVCWVAAPEAGLKAFRELGITVLRGAEPTIDAVAGMVRYARAQEAWTADAAAREKIALPRPDLAGLSGAVPTMTAAKLLTGCGVDLARAQLCDSADAVPAAGERLGWPLAMKIESPDILHKTEADGVRLGLADTAEAQAAFDDVLSRAKSYKPEARIDGVVVQEMVSGTVELVVGLKRDPVFGMVVMVGLGGIFVEVMKDVAFRKAPVTEAEAQDMLDELKGTAMLDGVRGKPAVDKAAIAALVVAVSRFGAAASDRLLELDLNPVLAGPDGARAVDWLMILDEAAGSD